jgi:peptide/nickel transport system substrate-binding protein
MSAIYRLAVAAMLAAGMLSLPAAPSRAAEKVVNLAYGAQGPGQLDPHLSTKSQDMILFGMMFNGLVRFKPGSINPESIEPDLATSWETSSDGLVWTFHLRHGVKFHRSYGEMTADDVVYSLKRAADPKQSSVASDYREFKSVEAVDRYTVRITLSEPVPSLLGLVVNYHGGDIVSKKAVEEMGANFKLTPVGTGPFAFAEYKQGQYVRLVANKDYFRGRPAIDTIIYHYIPSEASRELAFTNGEIDAFLGKREERWVQRVSKIKGLKVDVFGPGELRTLFFNMSIKPLDDIRVRKAIAHAINRDDLQALIGKSVTSASVSPVPNGYLGQTNDVPKYPYDLKKAKALLAEAGFPNGLKLSVIITKNDALLRPMEAIQAEVRQAGIDLDLNVVEHAAFHAQIRKNLSALVLYGAARFPVADTYLTQFYHSASIVGTPTAVTNFSHCKVADAEIDAARKETNAARQKELWVKAQQKIMETLCAVPLFEQLQVWARRDTIDYGFPLEGSMSLGPLLTEASTIAKR